MTNHFLQTQEAFLFIIDFGTGECPEILQGRPVCPYMWRFLSMKDSPIPIHKGPIFALVIARDAAPLQVPLEDATVWWRVRPFYLFRWFYFLDSLLESSCQPKMPLHFMVLWRTLLRNQVDNASSFSCLWRTLLCSQTQPWSPCWPVLLDLRIWLGYVTPLWTLWVTDWVIVSLISSLSHAISLSPFPLLLYCTPYGPLARFWTHLSRSLRRGFMSGTSGTILWRNP